MVVVCIRKRRKKMYRKNMTTKLRNLLLVVWTFRSFEDVEAMVEPVPVEPWNPMETVGSEAVQWWNAKLPGEVPPTQYWPLVDQQDLADRYAPGELGAEAASEAAGESAEARPVKPYHIPEYPLPPSAQSAPPPVMPFAALDLIQSTVAGIAPPISKVSDPGGPDAEGGEEGGEAAEAGLENDDVMDGSVGIAYEAPPLTKDDAIKYGGEEAPGGVGLLGVDPKVFNRKDSPNTYCNYCMAAFGADIFHSGCKSLPARMQGKSSSSSSITLSRVRPNMPSPDVFSSPSCLT